VLRHPPNEIGLGVESCATGKDRAQTFACAFHQFTEKSSHFAIDVAEKCEIERISALGNAIDANVLNGLVVQDDKSREI